MAHNIRLKHFIIVPTAVFLLSGCGTTRRAAVEMNAERLDSVRVERIVEYVTDSVFIEIPPQTAERTTRDSVSRLENDYATSEARINVDGSLYHDLKTKPQEKPVEFQKPVERRDSIVVKTETVTETVTVEVPRQLTWFQKTQIYGFWAFFAFLLITYTLSRTRL